MTQQTSTGITYDRAGPDGGQTVVLVHTGVADRRMWDPEWLALTAEHDTVRLDLRGYGDSTSRPGGVLSLSTTCSTPCPGWALSAER